MRPRIPASLLFALLAAFLPLAAHAQGSGRSMDIDVSIRSAGMGGASNAVFWGGSLNHWSNPALLGYATGIRYERGRTQLVPDLAEDVEIESQVLKAGLGGVGIVVSTDDPGPGGVFLDYGWSEGTDPFGNPTGTFRSWEQVDSWGFGVSVARTLESLMRGRSGEPRGVSRIADVSFGMNRKEIAVVLGPPGLGSAARTVAYDWGLLARVTPLRWDGYGLVLRGEMAYAHSELSYNDDATLTFLFEADRVSRHRRDGGAAHLAASPVWLERPSGRGLARELLRGFSPLLALGVAYERTQSDGGEGTSSYRTRGYGIEATLANVLTVRTGHYRDRAGDISDETFGYGVALPIGPWAGVRYDYAEFPEARGLSDLERRAYSAWIDPLAIWTSARSW